MRKLSAKEKHIYVTQELQRQGSYRKDRQHPEAIDHALNTAQSRIVKARLIPDATVPNKFQINQKFVTDIQAIIELDRELQVFKNNEKSWGVLPYDFSYLLSDSSYVIEDCKASFTNSSESKSERIYKFPFNSPRSTPPYFTAIRTSVSSNYKDFTSTVGYETQFEKVYVIDDVIDLYRKLGVTAYWENYKDLYYKDTLLIPSFNTSLNPGLIVDGTTVVGSYEDKTVTTFKANLTDSYRAINRDTKADFLDSALVSNFHKTIPKSPVSVLAANNLVVYGTERFLVYRILLNYIRKPRQISLSLGYGSELSGSVHEEICDLAVQILKKRIEDDSYVMNVQDNKGRIE